jgi:ribosomal protein S12 methylthiotransferase
VGFPGETEEEFEELRSFVEEIEFDHLGVFTYSHEPGAPSASLPDDVPAALKDDRRQVLLDLQEAISEKNYRSRIGSVLPVLIEGRGTAPWTFTGRAAFQAPEVDGCVTFSGAASGDGFTEVLIEDALPYELIGRTAGAKEDQRPGPVTDFEGRARVAGDTTAASPEPRSSSDPCDAPAASASRRRSLPLLT